MLKKPNAGKISGHRSLRVGNLIHVLDLLWPSISGSAQVPRTLVGMPLF